jgi:hypothetical protein
MIYFISADPYQRISAASIVTWVEFITKMPFLKHSRTQLLLILAYMLAKKQENKEIIDLSESLSLSLRLANPHGAVHPKELCGTTLVFF